MPTKSLVPILFAITIAALSASALASGNHAGGHDDSAIGKAGVAAKVNRTITVDMADNMRYTPSDIQVNKGETIRFVVKNSGKLKHELSLGTQKELLEHLEQMKKFPDMEHDEPSKVTVAPGAQGEIIWQFTKVGLVHFACLMPAHFEAGMKGQVKVAGVPSAAQAQSDNKIDMNPMTDGEVRKVDKEAGKVTIKHGEIKNLEMPPMTMVFTAKEQSLLDKVQVGDKVRFAVIREDGKMVVTEIQTVK